MILCSRGVLERLSNWQVKLASWVQWELSCGSQWEFSCGSKPHPEESCQDNRDQAGKKF